MYNRQFSAKATAKDIMIIMKQMPPRKPKLEAAGTGRSFKEEEPADQWEQQRSSTGSPESQGQDVIPPQDQDDPMGEEVVDLWAAEDEEDYVAQQATRSSI